MDPYTAAPREGRRLGGERAVGQGKAVVAWAASARWGRARRSPPSLASLAIAFLSSVASSLSSRIPWLCFVCSARVRGQDKAVAGLLRRRVAELLGGGGAAAGGGPAATAGGVAGRLP
jgi:hypothetical protein